ncbi:hypothetical protein HPB52_016457 [Rhipicephalus sanguineus]|uniref:Cullin-5 n=1 Tax=Rhipicephalus sanguineus TaxID=34632 RepID=A0A9D4SUQ1_RHISA|nr:hypothetical protein HPB52_016457 [Rhipicephalus sanguineus]
MKLVHAERMGEAIDSQLVVGVRESYVNLCSNPEDKLQIYRENFERAYIEATRQYAEQKLKEEEQRAAKYLESQSGVLVTAFREPILAECPGMIRAGETLKLQLMFGLVDRVPDGVLPMLHDLEQHVLSQGLADMLASADIITQAGKLATDSEKYVEQLLDLFQRFSKLVKEAFNDDPRFLTARDNGLCLYIFFQAFKQVVNDTSVFRLELPSRQKGVANKTQPESRCPELLANYCDMLLRKTPLSKKLTSDQIEAKLKEVLLVLRYVQNKDVFMRYHKAHLTRRLILDSSADSEKEENMVEWLRDVGMPADYVNKLARMFQDIKVSEDLNQQFKHAHRNSNELLAGSERVQVSLPLELEDFIPEVEEFYRRKHSGRKLQWYHHMSNGTITFCNQVGKFDLDVTTFQMAVMFAWNERPNERISFENLLLATELPDAELRRTLWEAIVKIMKMRKRITNAQLQTELVEILKNMFLPSKKMIKEQIEWLIEHKYMRRDEENINEFIYMA